MLSTDLLKPPHQVPSSAGLRPASFLRLLHLWHLLSLDAPTVATLWTAFIAHAAALCLPTLSLAAMFLAVWVLYAADRLLDAQQLHRHPIAAADLELRHIFHHRHKYVFLSALGLVTVLLAILIPQLAPAVIKPFLILGTLLAGYFVLIHASSGAHRLPKEFAVGLFFSAAVFIPTAARLSPLALRTIAPLTLLFAALCFLNCVCIYSWEHPDSTRPDSTAVPQPLTETASRHRRSLAAIILVASFFCAFATQLSAIAIAVALSSCALLLLDSFRSRLSALTLRVAADLALTTPALFLLWNLRN